MLKQVLCFALVAFAAAQNVDEQCGTCVVDGGPLTESGAVGYTYDPDDCGSYLVCIRRSERGDDGWMYTTFKRGCPPGTLWIQAVQSCGMCKDERVTCENSGPKPPLGSVQCPEDAPQGTTPLPAPLPAAGDNCTDDNGLMKAEVAGEITNFLIYYPNADPIGPVSCVPYNFSLSLCRCNAPEYSGVSFPFEGSFHAAGNIAFSVPNAPRNAYFVNESREGDQSVFLDGMGHIELPFLKQSSPRAPWSISMWFKVDPLVSYDRKVALLNNAKCLVLAPTFELSVQDGNVVVNIVTDNGTFSASTQVSGGYQDVWHSVRASYNGAILSLEADSGAPAEVPADGELVSNEAAWVIGRNCHDDETAGGPVSSLTGYVDQFEISYEEYSP